MDKLKVPQEIWVVFDTRSEYPTTTVHTDEDDARARCTMLSLGWRSCRLEPVKYVRASE